MTETIPEWFNRALDVPFEDHEITVAGAPVHYLQWGRGSGKPGLIFVHGNGAHAHWWTFLAPFFLEEYSVAAIDLTGAGDSGRRERYTPEQFAEEVNAVCHDSGFGSDTVVVGHSFGGYITLKTGLLYDADQRVAHPAGGMAALEAKPPAALIRHPDTRFSVAGVLVTDHPADDGHLHFGVGDVFFGDAQ